MRLRIKWCEGVNSPVPPKAQVCLPSAAKAGPASIAYVRAEARTLRKPDLPAPGRVLSEGKGEQISAPP